MIKIIIFLIILVSKAMALQCDYSQFADLEAVANFTVKNKYQCLKALAFDPESPTYSRSLIKRIDNEDTIVASFESNGFLMISFLSETGLRGLQLPIYKKSQWTSLPSDLIHVRSHGRDYYLALNFGDTKMLRGSQVYSEALDAMGEEFAASSKVSLKRKAKEYDDYLKSKKLYHLGNISDDPSIVEGALPALEKYQTETIRNYLTDKFQKIIPASSTILEHYNQFHLLSQSDREKYRRPIEDVKKEMMNDIYSRFPMCRDNIERIEIQVAVENFWSSRSKYYESIHQRFFP